MPIFEELLIFFLFFSVSLIIVYFLKCYAFRHKNFFYRFEQQSQLRFGERLLIFAHPDGTLFKGFLSRGVDQYLFGFLIFVEISDQKKNPTRKTCFSREMKRLALQIYLAKFCQEAFLWCQRGFYCIFMRKRCYNGGDYPKSFKSESLSVKQQLNQQQL